MDPLARSKIVCAVCHGTLAHDKTDLTCSNPGCQAQFPIINGIPILLSERLSTFNLKQYEQVSRHKPDLYARFRGRIRKVIPPISANIAARKNFNTFRDLLLASVEKPSVLILGGAEVGAGLKDLLADVRFDFIETDVIFGPRTSIVCDAAVLPFASSSLDGVIIQAVLEYLPDPAKCVDEIYRVLKPDGLVYSEMPFLQAVHGGRYDFTRLTHLGHLRLYRRFSELKSGCCAGPATALAWSVQHFFLGFVSGSVLRDLVKFMVGFGFVWLKYFDYYLVRQSGGIDGATGTYVLARKSVKVLSDRDLILHYRGAVPAGAII